MHTKTHTRIHTRTVALCALCLRLNLESVRCTMSRVLCGARIVASPAVPIRQDHQTTTACQAINVRRLIVRITLISSPYLQPEPDYEVVLMA